jgi:hypothetical protein
VTRGELRCETRSESQNITGSDEITLSFSIFGRSALDSANFTDHGSPGIKGV